MSQTILITGASRGIGAALALRYARENANLLLTARNAARLEGVAAQCRQAGAGHVDVGVFDIRDRVGVAAWVESASRDFPVDLLIANAGVTGGTAPDGALETADQSLALLEINVLGMAMIVHAVLPGMVARGHGQIAIISSIAAFVPLAGLPSYCASKAANLAYALSLRETLKPHGIKVSAVCPGYVDTPLLSRLEGEKPVLLSPGDAAERIFQGLARDKRIIAFPALHAFLSRLIALLPSALLRRAVPPIRVRPAAP